MTTALRIAVLGVGGVGGYFGALLARAGHAVTFVARGAQLTALRATGLRVRGSLGDFELGPVDARAPGEALPGCELVLVAVKNYDLLAALPALAALIGKTTTVVSLLNGIEAPALIAPLVARERLLVGQCGVGAWVESPGTICQEGTRRTITLAPFVSGTAASEVLAPVVQVLRAAGVSVSESDDAQAVMWHKLVWVASYGGIAALTGATAGELRSTPALSSSLYESMREGLCVARALAVTAPERVADDWMTVFAGLSPAARPSLLRDRQAGRRLEVEALSGAIVRGGQAAGLATPLHGLLWAALRSLESEHAGSSD